jgi:hypothetical protein
VGWLLSEFASLPDLWYVVTPSLKLSVDCYLLVFTHRQ